MLTVKQDHDGWFRIARNGRVLPGKGRWWNLYVTRAAALMALRRKRREAK